MKRKDLYFEIYNSVIAEVNITDNRILTDIQDSLSIFKFSDAFNLLSPQLSGDLISLISLIEKIKVVVNDPNIDLEEELVNPYDYVSLESATPSRKVHLHQFYYYKIDRLVVTSKCIYNNKFSDPILWESIELIWLNILNNNTLKSQFFNLLKNEVDSCYFILKNSTVLTADCWRIYSESYFEKVINGSVSIPAELEYRDAAICPGISPDWNNCYEQYHDSFNIIADMRNANDLLTCFLKMYQILEFFTFRLKLIPLTNGQATRNSFISNVRYVVETISKGELKSLQELFINVFKDIYKTEVNNFVEPVRSSSIKLYSYLNTSLNSSDKSMLGLKFTNFSNDSNVAELIYKIRCCIVHSKESEMHFTPNNVLEYKRIIPVMKVLIKVMQKSIVETINDSRKINLEFQNEYMLLY